MHKQKIQLFRPHYRVEECLSEIKDCLEAGWTGLGFKTKHFEEDWKAYTGFANAHFLNSATAGLNLALQIMKDSYQWNDCDEVITTPLTFVSSNHAILKNGMTPVFADVDNYMCLDPKDVEQKITQKTRAVMFVGLGGNTGQYLQIVELCEKYNLKLILDAAHMAGTRLNGVVPGAEAEVVVYSFQAVKNLPTADSGMICFKDEQLDKIARKRSWLGISKDTYARSSENQGGYKWMYDVEFVGDKYHGNSVMAALGIVQLKYLDEDNQKRRDLAKVYDEAFEGQEGLIVVKVAEGCESSRHFYQIRVNDRDDVLDKLAMRGIFCGVHYRDNTEYDMYSYASGSCPFAHDVSQKIISLPLHCLLEVEDIRYIANSLKDILACVRA